MTIQYHHWQFEDTTSSIRHGSNVTGIVTILNWSYIKISPVHLNHLYGPSPTNSAYFMIYFFLNYGQHTWAKPNNSSIFLPRPFRLCLLRDEISFGPYGLFIALFYLCPWPFTVFLLGWSHFSVCIHHTRPICQFAFLIRPTCEFTFFILDQLVKSYCPTN
jgi:hypothetical protein